MQCLFFHVWFRFSTIGLSSTYVRAGVKTIVFTYSTFCIELFASIHPVINTWTVPIFWLLWTMLQSTLAHTYLFVSLFSILIGIKLGIELLGHIVILCLALKVSPNSFSQSLQNLTFLSEVYEGSNLSKSLLTLGIFFFVCLLLCF